MTTIAVFVTFYIVIQHCSLCEVSSSARLDDLRVKFSPLTPVENWTLPNHSVLEIQNYTLRTHFIHLLDARIEFSTVSADDCVEQIGYLQCLRKNKHCAHGSISKTGRCHKVNDVAQTPVRNVSAVTLTLILNSNCLLGSYNCTTETTPVINFILYSKEHTTNPPMTNPPTTNPPTTNATEPQPPIPSTESPVTPIGTKRGGSNNVVSNDIFVHWIALITLCYWLRSATVMA